jgi:hypothetical protein
MFVPKWRDQVIDSSLRNFVNITTAAIYETEWSELGKMIDLTSRDSEYVSHEFSSWNNIWQVLKKRQGRKCISLKKSKALIFRIKCINNILPTKDICFQRKPKLYENSRCIACFKADESLYHIAECEVYQRIWKNLEEEALQLTRLDALTKLDILLDENLFREAVYDKEINTSLYNRKMHLRGLTNISQQKEVTKLTSSKKKTSKVLVSFIEHFWECFYKCLWKFRCEVMINWEKENNISAKEKKKKAKKKKAEANKENTQCSVTEKETRKEKDIRILNEAMSKVNNWVKFGKKEEWSRFKCI